MSVLWFGLSFAVAAQLIADGSMRDGTHQAFGCVAGLLAAGIMGGWLWALFVSARAGSPVNGRTQAMCAATAAAQLTTTLAMTVLMGGWAWSEPTGYFLGHAAVAALLAVLVGRSRKRADAREASRLAAPPDTMHVNPRKVGRGYVA